MGIESSNGNVGWEYTDYDEKRLALIYPNFI
jgi:hypothetical protein